MKIASINIQNIFHRDKDLIQSGLNKCVTDWVSELDALMRGDSKTERDTERIRELSFLLGFERTEPHAYGILRKRNGGLYLKECNFSQEGRASEESQWRGWIPLRTLPILNASVRNKARMIAEADPDILIVQEVEDKAALDLFNNTYLSEFGIRPFERTLVLEGNDARGLGMGIMSKNGYRLDTVKSHTTEKDRSGRPLFETDCQEYFFMTPEVRSLRVISVQFSKDDESLRKRQAEAVADIYEAKIADGEENVIICGTLNDASYSDSLSPLIRHTDLKDSSKHPNFNVATDHGRDASYFRMGAYQKGVNIRQKDYLLLSPVLFKGLTETGLNRKAMWPERLAKWSLYPSVQKREQAASRHPLLWSDIQI
ncbi:Exonuclease III [Maribacter dokdonensis]|uniref:endonuclease/exonuclease/phosphatase family protein n=1 Tax=Maribacter dokdonensis TaxID=320912 RepID=UPI001B240E8F|nr:endonuclease/exonuclease/phosphatase family protein [Maribacter dokdonensis]CAG2532831.1 Exonuclease III [Maribacter dokdonensis]